MILLANLLLPLTVALSLVTLGIGLCACPMQSLTLQHAFCYCSAATILLGIASLIRHVGRSELYQRAFKFELGVIPLVLFWGFLLWTNEIQVREGSARTLMTFHGRNVGLGVHDFHNRNERLPADIRDPAGLPLLSWRVSICPYIDAMPQFQQFDQAKPWDSHGNIRLLEKIPPVYQSVLFSQAEGSTPWQGFAGPGTAFDPGNAKLNWNRDFPDGTSNTILVIEAQQHVPWSKPADIPYGPNIPLPALGQNYPSKGDWPFCCPVERGRTFMVCMADGTVRMVSADISETTMRTMIERNDGRPVELPE